MQIEKATQEADLPHQYANNCDGVCRVCRREALDARHTAWERACLVPMPEPVTLTRERGA